MKVKYFATKDDWLEGRKGKITGSVLKDIVVKRGSGEKVGFYQIIADRISQKTDEDPMERGSRLEPEAIDVFSSKIGKDIDTSLVIWERDDNPSIAISPDGFMGETEAVEVKCLSGAKHIESYLTNKIPEEYHYQVLQYFIVNEKLETLYFVLYNPEMPEKIQMHYFIISRKDVQDQVDTYTAYQKEKLATIDEIINTLTF
jgi:putative phage-type endonuclease